MENEPKVVNLLLKTWPNDIGGIFDYSTKSVQTVKNIIVESTYVVRDKNNNSIENKQQHSSIQKNNEDLLFHVLIDINNKYSLYNPQKMILSNLEKLNLLLKKFILRMKMMILLHQWVIQRIIILVN